ncbi:PAS domain-containing protein [Methylobacterium sp. A54F]
MPTRSLMRPDWLNEGADAGRRRASVQHFLKLIEERGEIGFWSADIRTDDIDGSVGLYRVLGLDSGVALTFGLVRQMMHPDDRQSQADPLVLLRSGQPLQREFRVIRPDRTQRWVASRAEVILGADDRPVSAIGILQDVTLRYESRHSVEQEQDRFNALIAATAAVVWMVSPDGQSLDMPQWQALTGQSHAEIQGSGWLAALHPDDRERARSAWVTAISHVAPYNTDYRILCADGIFRWFNSRGIPILNRDGSVREWVGVCLSIPGQNRFGTGCQEGRPPASTEEREITPAQIRAARGMIGLSADEVARRAEVSNSTIRRLEDETSGIQARRETLMAVRRVLEQAGAAFTFEAGVPPGVRPALR